MVILWRRVRACVCYDSETQRSRGKSLASGGTDGGTATTTRRRRRRRARDGVETRARRMAGMNGPRQTAENARVVAARRARSPAATLRRDSRAV